MNETTALHRRHPLGTLLILVSAVAVGLAGHLVISDSRGPSSETDIGRLIATGQVWCPERLEEKQLSLVVRNELDRNVELRTSQVKCGDWSGAGNPTSFNTLKVSPFLGLPKSSPGALLSLDVNSERQGLESSWKMTFLDPPEGGVIGIAHFRLTSRAGDHFQLESLNRGNWTSRPLQLESIRGSVGIRSLHSGNKTQHLEILLEPG